MLVFKIHSSAASAAPDEAYKLEQRQCVEDDLADVIAISYAWGSLNHKQAFDFGNGFGLKLGDEWDFDGFLKELVVLSRDAWLWMDQLSLHQSTATTAELNISIPMIYKTARVLVLLPGSECEERRALVESPVRFGENARLYTTTGVVIDRLYAHRRLCKNNCIGGIDVWLSRVWPWQEFAYANRLQVRFAAGRKLSRELPGDTMTLLRQQVLDKYLQQQVHAKAAQDEAVIDLLRGAEVTFGKFAEPTPSWILAYMSNYVEQCRNCTRDLDLIAAVAPAIGASTSKGSRLADEVRGLIQYVERATGTVYVGPLPCGIVDEGDRSLPAHDDTFQSFAELSAKGMISLLHGTHFAYGGERGVIDDALTVEILHQDKEKFTGKEVLDVMRAMSLSQRRMMVRFLSSWEPSADAGPFDRLFEDLKPNMELINVTSELSDWLDFRRSVIPTNKKQLTRLALMLLRVIDETDSLLAHTLVTSCELVKISCRKGTTVYNALGYQRKGAACELVAVGDCLLLVSERGDGLRHVVGRVPFTSREALQSGCSSAIPALARDADPGTTGLITSRLTAPVKRAIRDIEENAVAFVDLSGNQVDDEAAVALSNALRTNASVKALLLQDNRIGKRGIDAISGMLTVNATLSSVHLPHGQQPLRSDPRVVQWSDDEQPNWRCLLRADPNPTGRTPEYFVISDNLPVRDAAVLALSEAIQHTCVTYVELQRVLVSERSFRAFTDVLRGSKTLFSVSLRFEATPVNLDALGRSLRGNATLSELHISGATIDASAARELASALKVNTRLDFLDLESNNIDDDTVAILVDGLAQNTRMDILGLGRNAIGDRGAAAIARVLVATNESISQILLSENQIGCAGANAIAAALSMNQRTEELFLDLSGNQIGDDEQQVFATVVEEIDWLRVDIEGQRTTCTIESRENTRVEQGVVALIEFT